jgi:hypothetical protein
MGVAGPEPGSGDDGTALGTGGGAAPVVLGEFAEGGLATVEIGRLKSYTAIATTMTAIMPMIQAHIVPRPLSS